jgi:hypothetical protein
LKPTGTPAVEAFGDIGSDGTFTLTTYRPGDGAIPGTYKVAISPYLYRTRSGSPAKMPNASDIPRRYLEGSTSDLTIEIKETDNVLDVRLRN